MVHFERTFPAPPCLEAEFAKANGTYRCEGVATQLKVDFKNKCYLCEQLEPTSINIEHFREHRGNQILKLAWRNLYYACSHCNGTKEAVSSGLGLLDCTKVDHRVDACLSYRLEYFPSETEVRIEVVEPRTRAANTIALLLAIYNGHTTEQKSIEAANLRSHLGKELLKFKRFLEMHADNGLDGDELAETRESIIAHLQNSSAFTAFKRWIIRDHPVLFKEFGGTF